jgi:hypothetical protein
MNGLGLNVTGFSYHGKLWVCSVACREMMPDPNFFADCMRAAFDDLVAAADAAAAEVDEPRARPAATRTVTVERSVRKTGGGRTTRPSSAQRALRKTVGTAVRKRR